MIQPGNGVTTNEAAEILGITRHAIYMATMRGALPRYGNTRGHDFDRADVETRSLALWNRREPHPYWVTARGAAEILGLHRSGVRHLVDTDRLPAVVDNSGRHAFRRHQVENIAAAREARVLRA
jgi:hypothetical protein